MAPYRAGTIKRIRRSSERVEQLDSQIITVLAEDQGKGGRRLLVWRPAVLALLQDQIREPV